MHRYLIALALSCASMCHGSLYDYLTKPVKIQVGTPPGAILEIPKRLAFLSDTIQTLFFNKLEETGLPQTIRVPVLASLSIAKAVQRYLLDIDTLITTNIDYHALRNYLMDNTADTELTFWSMTSPLSHTITKHLAHIIKNLPDLEILSVLNAGKEDGDQMRELNFGILTTAQMQQLALVPGVFRELVTKTTPWLTAPLSRSMNTSLPKLKVDPVELLNSAHTLGIPLFSLALAEYIGTHLDTLLTTLPRNGQGIPTMQSISPALTKKIIYTAVRSHPKIFFPLEYTTTQAATALPTDHESFAYCDSYLSSPLAISKLGSVYRWPSIHGAPRSFKPALPTPPINIKLQRYSSSPNNWWITTELLGHGIDAWGIPTDSHIWLNYLWCNVNNAGVLAAETNGHTVIVHAHDKSPIGRVPGNCPFFNDQGTILATTMWDEHKTNLWDSKTLELKQVIPETLHRLESNPFSKNGKLIGTVRDMQAVHVYEIETGNFKVACTLKRADNIPVTVKNYTISPGGTYIAVTFSVGEASEAKNECALWHIPSQQRIASLPGSTFGSFSANEKYCVLAAPQCALAVLTLNESLEPDIKHLREHINTITCINFLSKKGTLFASSSKDNTIRIWSTATGTLLYTLVHSRSVRDSSWIPEAQQIVGLEKHAVTIWKFSEIDLPATLSLDQLLAVMTLATDTKLTPEVQAQIFSQLGSSVAGRALCEKLKKPTKQTSPMREMQKAAGL